MKAKTGNFEQLWGMIENLLEKSPVRQPPQQSTPAPAVSDPWTSEKTTYNAQLWGWQEVARVLGFEEEAIVRLPLEKLCLLVSKQLRDTPPSPEVQEQLIPLFEDIGGDAAA